MTDWISFISEPETQGSLLARHAHLRSFTGRKRLLILGNGPSLANYDLGQFKDDLVVCVNDLFAHPQFADLNPLALIFADPDYFKPSTEPTSYVKNVETAVQLIQAKSLDTLVCAPLPYAFHCVQTGLLDIHRDVFWIYGQHTEMPDKMGSLFLTPNWGQNVLGVALMIALFIGVEDIYLLGFDHAGIQLESLDNGHCCEFGARERTGSEIWTQSQMHTATFKFITQIHAIQRYADRHSTQIWNANPASKLRLFPFAKPNGVH